MISIPGSLLCDVIHPCKKNLRGMPDARPKVHPSMHGNQHCPIQSPLKSVLGVRSSYVECKYAFPLLRKCFSLHKHMPQCKFSLYLKKAGLASQNIVHVFKKLFYVVSSGQLYRSLLLLSFVFV